MTIAVPSLRAAIISGGTPSWVPRLDGMAADLVFDFANQRGWQSRRPATDASLVAVTRATTTSYGRNAAGVYVPYSANTIRYDDVLGGALIEEARTNDGLWARDLTNAAWVKVSSTAALTQTGADGTPNAASLITATSGSATVLQSLVKTSATRTQSFSLKRVSGSGNILITTDGTTWTSQSVTNEFGRFSVTQTLANPVFGIQVASSGDQVAVDFVQNEVGAFGTSPMPTTTASASRAADRLICDQADDYGPTGTMLVEWVGASSAHYAQSGVIAGLANTAAPSFSDCIYCVALAGGTNVNLSIVRAGVGQAAATSRAPLVNSTNKFCATWSNGHVARALNGTLDLATGGLGVPTAVQNRVSVGSASWSAGNFINYVIRRVAFWKTTRSDSAVQGATV